MEEEIRSLVEENPDGSRRRFGSSFREILCANDARGQWAKEKSDLEDLLRRRQAEFENFRRRVERERWEFAEYAGMEGTRGLLPIVDDFERALKAAKASGSSETELVKGIELIYKRLLETLIKQGLEPISIENRKFDPHLHEAVQRVQDDDAEDGTILEEYQRGYNFKGKLLRPSMVKVAVRS